MSVNTVVGWLWVSCIILVFIACIFLILSIGIKLNNISNFDIHVINLLLLRIIFVLTIGAIDVITNLLTVAPHNGSLCTTFRVIWMTLQCTEIFLVLVLLVSEIIHMAKKGSYKQKTRSVFYHTVMVLCGGLAVGLVPLYIESEDSGTSLLYCDLIMSGITELPVLLLLILHCLGTPLSVFALVVLSIQSHTRNCAEGSVSATEENGHMPGNDAARSSYATSKTIHNAR